jgi:hypothetical protein
MVLSTNTTKDKKMKKATIEYMTAAGNCKSATGFFMGYSFDGEVYVLVNGRKKKGMLVEWL